MLTDLTLLTQSELLICAGIIFLASVVRGFSGFALSALVMSGAILILPPVQLIPLCFLLESVASMVMLRGGWKRADMSVVRGLVIGSIVGIPFGLLALTQIPEGASRLIILLLILALTLAQLFQFSPAFIATRKGIYLSGFAAGIANGMASVGGMVVALFVLARRSEAKTMRASLVMYLFTTLFTTLFFLLLYGILDRLALNRALVFGPIAVVGVVLGSLLFRPSLEVHYKRFCLLLLLLLSAIGLARII